MLSRYIAIEPRAPAAQEAVARAGLLSLLLLSCGHFFVDLYSSALGALQPLLVQQFGMSLTDAGVLGGVLVTSSSVMQPVYGFFSDRLHTRMFAALGPAVAGIFISSLGLAPGYGWLLAMVWLGGAGVAAFHPQATARATLGMEEKRGRAMAIFISAGTLGLASGPTYFSIATGWLGLGRTFWGALPGIAVSVLLITMLPAGPSPRPAHARKSDWSVLRAFWKPIAILYTLVVIRSIVQVTFTQFIPLYLHLERGYEVATANYTLSLYLVFGAVGGFLGGHLADRFGGRLVILISMIGSVPFLLLFFLTGGVVSLIGLLLGGLILLFTIPVNVVMAQELVPSQAGTVSALMMGFGWGTAGLVFIPLTGFLSDLFSLHHVLLALSVFPVLGFFLSLRLPK
jgi:FSR family fosmidomycin resistance protein-like MFS transporter